MSTPFSTNNPGIGGLDELTAAEEQIVSEMIPLGSPTEVWTVDGAGTGGEWAAAGGGAPEGTAVISTGVSVGWVLQADGDNTSSWVALGGGGDALTANPLSQFAATTSAQLLGVISDETGTGSLVFGTSPTLVTPALGTPSALVATNATGTAAGLTAGAATLAISTSALKSATTTVNVDSATAPTVGQVLKATSSTAATWQAEAGGAPEGTAVLSTGEVGGNKFLREDGDGTCSWQAGAGGIANVVEDTTPQLGGMLDVNGNSIGDGTLELLTFTEDASAVNHINIENEATGSGPIISAVGDDTSVNLNVRPKGGLGRFAIQDAVDPTKQFIFYPGDATTGDVLTVQWAGTADRTITMPDATDILVGKATTDTLTNKTLSTGGSITSGFGAIDVGTDDITGGTLNATGDTSVGDNAAIGYTATEGLILTGQGSTNDISIKNDADNYVLTVPTGTQDVRLYQSLYIAEQAEANADVASYGQIWVDTATPNKLMFTDDVGSDFVMNDVSDNLKFIDFIVVDPATDVATGTGLITWSAPFAGTIVQDDTDVDWFAAYTTTAGTTGTMVVDIHKGGTTIMTTNKLDIETTELDTTLAATQPDLTTTTFAAGDVFTIDVDAIHTTAAKGLVVRMAVRPD